jgi:hypothetical protein
MTTRDDAERAAIEHAKEQFRKWQRPCADLSAIRRGARALLSASPDFHDWDGQLLAQMQAQPPQVNKQAVVEELERMRITLQRIDTATVPTRGLRSHDAESLILFAADAWVDFTGNIPSSADRSRFVNALKNYGEGAGIPKVTRDHLQNVLPRWLAFRG